MPPRRAVPVPVPTPVAPPIPVPVPPPPFETDSLDSFAALDPAEEAPTSSPFLEELSEDDVEGDPLDDLAANDSDLDEPIDATDSDEQGGRLHDETGIGGELAFELNIFLEGEDGEAERAPPDHDPLAALDDDVEGGADNGEEGTGEDVPALEALPPLDDDSEDGSDEVVREQELH